MQIMESRELNQEYLKYLQSISREELMTVEDEIDLVRQIQLGEGDVSAAKDKLMRANQRFVRAVAQRYVSEKHSLEELMAEGNLGLEHAIYEFDEARGFRFIAYAVWYIRQSIRQAIVLKAKAEIEQKVLSKREVDILRMYFGIGCEKASIEEIQAKYDLTPKRVMFIKDKALQALRTFFKSFKGTVERRTVILKLMEATESDEKTK